MTLRRGMVLWLVVLAILGSIPALAAGQASPVAEGSGVGPLELIATLTGPDSINQTDTRWGVDGTDLGHSFVSGDAIYMVFGDTFGPGNTDWRSNVAAVITDDDPTDGLTFDRMIEDIPGHAKELISPNDVEGFEVTVIPTNGIAIGDRLVLHYMAVYHWGNPGHWDLSQSGLAYSDDAGETWTVDPNAVWPGDSHFGQVAFVEEGDYVYLFGIPGGRFGGVALARVEPEQILNLDAYEYWDGSDWVRGDATAAVEILPAPVGELSVRWNSYYGKWLMMYLNENKYAIVLRTADCLAGPWDEERTVTTGLENPQLYAPFMLPKWNDGPEIYFTMSLFGPYNVNLMATSLTDVTSENATPAATC